MILSLSEAALIDSRVTQGRLDGIEAFVRSYTRNPFHVKHTHVEGVNVLSNTNIAIPLDKSRVLAGDTVELTECGTADGLYRVVTTTETLSLNIVVLAVEGGPAFRGKAQYLSGNLDVVAYPADIIEGVAGMLAYDAARAGMVGLKSKTVGRVTESYTDAFVETSEGVYPASALAFLAPYRRLSWGR